MIAVGRPTNAYVSCIPEVVAREQLKGIRLVINARQVDGLVEVFDCVLGVLDENPRPGFELPEDEREEAGQKTEQDDGDVVLTGAEQ